MCYTYAEQRRKVMVRRFSENPLISPENVKSFDDRFEVVGVFNPGVATFDGKTLLLMRVAVRPEENGIIRVPVFKNGKITVMELDKRFDENEDSRVVTENGKKYLTSMSYFLPAVSEDGESFKIISDGAIYPESRFEEYGVEDPRITFLENRYYITYSAISEYGICAAMKVTDDFKTYENIGVVLHPDNKDVALFPEKINGKYYMLHRPSTSEFGCPELWIAESDNLVQWGNHKRIMGVRKGMWDSSRIGSSGIPLRVEEGWLIVYHGANENNEYCLGAALLDAERPWKVIGRTEKPFLKPELPCEKGGFFPNIVFSCGGVKDGNLLKIYYGAADKCICGCEISIDELLSEVKTCQRE